MATEDIVSGNENQIFSPNLALFSTEENLIKKTPLK